MGRSNNPLDNLGGRVAKSVTNRLIGKLAAVAVAALLGAVGLKQCGQPVSRESVAQRSTAVINVNTASVENLMLLPRINENLARSIVAGRPYATVDDLLKVSGIGPKTLEGLRARVVVDAAAKPAK